MMRMALVLWRAESLAMPEAGPGAAMFPAFPV